jgi:hypothetical protein
VPTTPVAAGVGLRISRAAVGAEPAPLGDTAARAEPDCCLVCGCRGVPCASARRSAAGRPTACPLAAHRPAVGGPPAAPGVLRPGWRTLAAVAVAAAGLVHLGL